MVNVTRGNPPLYSFRAFANYTQETIHYTGVYDGCVYSTQIQRDSCVLRFPLNFTCMVDSHIDEGHPRINWVYFEDEMTWIRLKFTLIIGCFYIIVVFLLILTAIVLCVADRGDILFEKLQDHDLGNNRIPKAEYRLMFGENTKESSNLIGSAFTEDQRLFKYLCETASEKFETIEWIHHPSLTRLLFSSYWSAISFLILMLIPVWTMAILFGVYFGIAYYWKVEGIILIEICLGYGAFIFLLFVLLYILSASGTKYYLTSSRAICIIKLLGVTWIYQFPFEDIDSIILQGYDAGSIAVRSRSLRTEVKLFSYVPNLQYVEDFLNRKMATYEDYDPDYERTVQRLDE